MRDLSPKQRRFVELYALEPNGTRAAMAAGYHERSAPALACGLLKQPKIRSALLQEYASKRLRTSIDQDYVVATAVELVERCMQGERLRDAKGKLVYETYANGEIVAVWKFDPSNAAKALTILAKHLGMDQSTLKITGEVIHTHTMTPELSAMLDDVYKDGVNRTAQGVLS